MTPLDVRERLLSIGVDLSGYSNDLAVIHTVLKRLNEAGELRSVPRPSGKNDLSLGQAAARGRRSGRRSPSSSAASADRAFALIDAKAAAARTSKTKRKK